MENSRSQIASVENCGRVEYRKGMKWGIEYICYVINTKRTDIKKWTATMEETYYKKGRNWIWQLLTYFACYKVLKYMQQN